MGSQSSSTPTMIIPRLSTSGESSRGIQSLRQSMFSSSSSNTNTRKRTREQDHEEAIRCSKRFTIFHDFSLFRRHVTTMHGATVDSNYMYDTTVNLNLR